MRDSWGSFVSLLGGMGVVQMGQDVVGVWAAEASSLVAQSPEVAKGGKRRRDRVVGSTLHRGCVCPLKPWDLPRMAESSQPLQDPQAAVIPRGGKMGVPLTFLKIAVPREKAPGYYFVLVLRL